MASASDIPTEIAQETPADGTSGSPGGSSGSDSLLQAAVSYLEFEVELAGGALPLEFPAAARNEIDNALKSAPEPVVTPANKSATKASSKPAFTGVGAGYPPYEQLRAAIPADSPLHEMTTLADVERYVAETVLIPLDESRLNPVFGVGNPAADLLVIGEAPGADEDKKGEPFVGRAGQLLDKILQAIGFARSDVYIANILKSRPPNNRNPSPIEVAAHLPLLLKQIMLIQPKLILCVGRTAGTSLLGVESSLSALRGRFHDFHGVPVMVTYHPAALLRNPNWKPATWEDVQALRARYDELTS